MRKKAQKYFGSLKRSNEVASKERNSKKLNSKGAHQNRSVIAKEYSDKGAQRIIKTAMLQMSAHNI